MNAGDVGEPQVDVVVEGNTAMMIEHLADLLHDAAASLYAIETDDGRITDAADLLDTLAHAVGDVPTLQALALGVWVLGQLDDRDAGATTAAKMWS